MMQMQPILILSALLLVGTEFGLVTIMDLYNLLKISQKTILLGSYLKNVYC